MWHVLMVELTRILWTRGYKSNIPQEASGSSALKQCPSSRPTCDGGQLINHSYHERLVFMSAHTFQLTVSWNSPRSDKPGRKGIPGGPGALNSCCLSGLQFMACTFVDQSGGLPFPIKPGSTHCAQTAVSPLFRRLSSLTHQEICGSRSHHIQWFCSV